MIYVHLCMSLINLKRWAVNNHTYYGYLAESCVTINMKDWYPQCSPVKQVTPSSTLEKESIKCIILTVMYIISLTCRCFSSKLRQYHKISSALKTPTEEAFPVGILGKQA